MVPALAIHRRSEFPKRSLAGVAAAALAWGTRRLLGYLRQFPVGVAAKEPVAATRQHEACSRSIHCYWLNG